MAIPQTTNIHFDRAIELLLQYHEILPFQPPRINFATRPVGIRTDRQWSDYLDALMTVEVIGKRNGWTRWHVNRRGQVAFLVVDVPPSKGG